MRHTAISTGAHRLLIPNFYPFVQRYMQPHQREITLVLAYLVQGCHELVPPESLQPLLRTLAQHFVSDKSRPEMVAIGINTTREVCAREVCAREVRAAGRGDICCEGVPWVWRARERE